MDISICGRAGVKSKRNPRTSDILVKIIPGKFGDSAKVSSFRQSWMVLGRGGASPTESSGQFLRGLLGCAVNWLSIERPTMIILPVCSSNRCNWMVGRIWSACSFKMATGLPSR